jgi:hypothetical protein
MADPQQGHESGPDLRRHFRAPSPKLADDLAHV